MKQQTMIITGANGNVGSYFANEFYKLGYKLVLIVHRATDRIAHLAEDDRVRIITCDIRDGENLTKMIQESFSDTDWQPNALIHTAAIRSADFQSLADTNSEIWKDVFDVNLNGTYNILKAVIPFFRKNHYGRIVLFGSNVSRRGLPRGSAYSASKAAIANLCRSVASEEAKHKIIINTISPGPIKIDDSHFSESYRKFREDYYNKMLDNIPLKRHASIEDVYGLCRFLISDENSYITGEEFYVTGGSL